MTRLEFLLLILSVVGCTGGPIRPSYPTHETKARANERKRRKKTGYERRYKKPK